MNGRWNQVLWSVVFVLLCAAGHAQTGASIQAPVDRSPVQIFATALAKDGSPAAPAPATLNVSIDRQPAKSVSMRSAKDDKLLFALTVDISSSEAPEAKAIKEAAVRVFEALSTGENRGYIVLLNTTVAQSNRPLQPAEVSATLDRIHFGGGTALFDGIGQICGQVLGKSQNPDSPRRILIIFSDGSDNYSHLTLDEAEEAAERQGVAIFSLAVRAHQSSSSAAGDAVLRQVSRDTGGREILVDKLSDGIAPLLFAIQAQQALSIVPSQQPDRKLHSLVVKSTTKDTSVSVPAHILLL